MHVIIPIILLGTTNQYVDVTFESARQVVCKFLGPAQTPSEVFCSITYGPCQQRLNMSAEGSSISVHESHTTVRIDLSTNLNTYCYLINASNGTFNLLMEGSYGEYCLIYKLPMHAWIALWSCMLTL